MADRNVLLKLAIKQIAYEQGKCVTFMAKLSEKMPGSSCHIHFSLKNSAGENAFAGDEPLAEGITCSVTMKHFLAGWIKYIPELMPFYAPTVNSYKRFSKDWAPANRAWGIDNRSCGFRICGEGKNVHIECRIPGADANCYLAFAASYACGLKGI